MIELIITMIVGVMVLVPLSFLMVTTFTQLRETIETTRTGSEASAAMTHIREKLEMASEFRIFDAAGTLANAGPLIVFDMPDFGSGATKQAFRINAKATAPTNRFLVYYETPDTTPDSWFATAWPPASSTSTVSFREISDLVFTREATTGRSQYRVSISMTVIDGQSPYPDETDRVLESVVFLRNQP